jgi:hypothetical protein
MRKGVDSSGGLGYGRSEGSSRPSGDVSTSQDTDKSDSMSERSEESQNSQNKEQNGATMENAMRQVQLDAMNKARSEARQVTQDMVYYADHKLRNLPTKIKSMVNSKVRETQDAVTKEAESVLETIEEEVLELENEGYDRTEVRARREAVAEKVKAMPGFMELKVEEVMDEILGESELTIQSARDEVVQAFESAHKLGGLETPKDTSSIKAVPDVLRQAADNAMFIRKNAAADLKPRILEKAKEELKAAVDELPTGSRIVGKVEDLLCQMPGPVFAEEVAQKTELMAREAITETLDDIDRIADVTNDSVSRAIMQAKTEVAAATAVEEATLEKLGERRCAGRMRRSRDGAGSQSRSEAGISESVSEIEAGMDATEYRLRMAVDRHTKRLVGIGIGNLPMEEVKEPDLKLGPTPVQKARDTNGNALAAHRRAVGSEFARENADAVSDHGFAGRGPASLPSQAGSLPTDFNGIVTLPQQGFDTPPQAPRRCYSLTDLRAAAPSLGSHGHPEMCRKMCSFYWLGSCEHGSQCNFCHRPHTMRRKRLEKRHRRQLDTMTSHALLSLTVEITKGKFPNVDTSLVKTLDEHLGWTSEQRVDSAVRRLYREQSLSVLLHMVRRVAVQDRADKHERIIADMDTFNETILEGCADTLTGMMHVIPRSDRLIVHARKKKDGDEMSVAA